MNSTEGGLDRSARQCEKPAAFQERSVRALCIYNPGAIGRFKRSMPKRLLLSILAIVTPIAAHAEPEPEPARPDAAVGACEDPRTCAAVEFADALSSQSAGSQVRLGFLIAFEPGRARVYSKDRERLMALAASWRHNNAWATITVEGYAGASSGAALAQRRADKISDYLIRYGVAAEYVVAIGHESVRGDVPNERAVGGHVELTLERCPRSAAECRHKPLKPVHAAASTVQ
jgi:outer membrane protein OmpA-like peptidoglycan-associated protein